MKIQEKAKRIHQKHRHYIGKEVINNKKNISLYIHLLLLNHYNQKPQALLVRGKEQANIKVIGDS